MAFLLHCCFLMCVLLFANLHLLFNFCLCTLVRLKQAKFSDFQISVVVVAAALNITKFLDYVLHQFQFLLTAIAYFIGNCENCTLSADLIIIYQYTDELNLNIQQSSYCIFLSLFWLEAIPFIIVLYIFDSTHPTEARIVYWIRHNKYTCWNDRINSTKINWKYGEMRKTTDTWKAPQYTLHSSCYSRRKILPKKDPKKNCELLAVTAFWLAPFHAQQNIVSANTFAQVGNFLLVDFGI